MTLGASVTNGAVRFTVKDTGKGIPKEYQERIFEKFFQVPESGPKGTGLGLPICKEIVEHHGGHIWLDDTNYASLKTAINILEEQCKLLKDFGHCRLYQRK